MAKDEEDIEDGADDAAEAPGKAASKTGAKPAAGKPGAGKAAAAVEAPADEARPKKRPEIVPIHGPDSLIDRLQPYVKQIAIGGLIAFGVIGVFVGWRWMHNRSAAKSTAKLAVALDISSHPVVAPGETPPPTTKTTTYASAKDRAEAALAALAQAGSVGKQQALWGASQALDAGKLDEAEAMYKDAASEPGLDGVLAREGLGYVAEARFDASKDPAEQQKLLEAALAAFQAMQPDAAGPRYDYALYHQARILALLGKNAEARATFAKALEAAPKSEIKGDIEARLALLGGP